MPSSHAAAYPFTLVRFTNNTALILPPEADQHWREISSLAASETFTHRRMQRIVAVSPHANSSVNGANVTGLQGCQQNWIHLPPNTGQTTCPVLYYIWPTGTTIVQSKQRSLSELTTLLSPGSSVVEPTPDHYQDSTVIFRKRLKTHLSFAAISPMECVVSKTWAAIPSSAQLFSVRARKLSKKPALHKALEKDFPRSPPESQLMYMEIIIAMYAINKIWLLPDGTQGPEEGGGWEWGVWLSF